MTVLKKAPTWGRQLSLLLVGLFASLFLAQGTAFAASGDWSGLLPAQSQGPNVAYVDQSSLSADEISEIRQLDAGETVVANWRYKLVYEPIVTPSSTDSTSSSSAEVVSPSSASSQSSTSQKPTSQASQATTDASLPETLQKLLPQTGDTTSLVLLLVGLALIGGTLYVTLTKRHKGGKTLLFLLLGTGTLALGTSVAQAYSGNALETAILVETGETITVPDIDGYTYVGVIVSKTGTLSVSYEDVDGNPVYPDRLDLTNETPVASETSLVEEGTTYTAEQKTLKGYRFVGVKEGSAPATGTATEGDTQVTMVYEMTDDDGSYVYNIIIQLPPIEQSTTFSILDRTDTTPGSDGTVYTPFNFVLQGAPVIKYKDVQVIYEGNGRYSVRVDSYGYHGDPITDKISSNWRDDLTVTWNGTTYSWDGFLAYINQTMSSMAQSYGSQFSYLDDGPWGVGDIYTGSSYTEEISDITTFSAEYPEDIVTLTVGVQPLYYERL